MAYTTVVPPLPTTGAMRGGIASLWATATVAGLLACAGCTKDSCAVCLAEKCADLIDACPGEDCRCMVQCLGDNGVPGSTECLSACKVDARPEGFAAVEACVAVACPDNQDECATPAGYMPPEAMVCQEDGAPLGDGSPADCDFDASLPFDLQGPVLQLQSPDGAFCARVQRRNEGPGSLANTQWSLVELRVGAGGEVAVVSDPAAQCWYASHHNFRDVVHAWSGTRHYDLLLQQDGHDGAQQYTLYVFSAGPLPDACSASVDSADCLTGPIALVPVGP